MSQETFESKLAKDFEGHLGQYTKSDNFVCILCSYESNDPLACLFHMHQKHNFAVSNLRALSLLQKYLDHWRFHPQPIIESTIYGSNVQTIDPENPAEIELRKILHELRLKNVMDEYEYERTQKINDIQCLFCKKKFSGTWQQYLQWMFEEHRFNPGRPANLVYIPELVEHLRNQINNNICIHCNKQFAKPHMLRAHMKKKPHDKIPDSKYFDRFYMVNYLEPGKTWADIEPDGDEDESNISLEEGLKDFDCEPVIEETKCLICDTVLATPLYVVDHMHRFHNFDLKDVQKTLGNDFYKMVRFVNYARTMKNEGKCFICGSPVVGDYADHIYSHENKNPVDIFTITSGEKFLIPVIESDPLLTVLEDL